MSYSTVEAVRNRLAPGSWTSSTPDPGTDQGPSLTGTAADLSRAQLLDQIGEADSIIDAYIGGRYAIPVQASGDPATVPHPIDFLSRDIAAYYATLLYRKNQNLDPTDPVQLAFNQAMALLNNVQSGKATLPGIPDSSGDTSGTSSGIGTPEQPYIGDLMGVGLVNYGDFDLTGPLHPGWGNRLPDGRWIFP